MLMVDDGALFKAMRVAGNNGAMTCIHAENGPVIQVLVGANRSVTFGTLGQVPAGTPLLSGHAYTVVGVDTDGAGNAIALRLRNPWGEDGAGNDGSNDGYVTVTPQQALDALAGVCTAVV